MPETGLDMTTWVPSSDFGTAIAATLSAPRALMWSLKDPRLCCMTAMLPPSNWATILT